MILTCKLISICHPKTKVAQMQFKNQGVTQKTSQPCDTEEIVSWQITGMAKMNALKEIRDIIRPKKVNNKFKHTQIRIATKDKPSLSYQLFTSFCNIETMSHYQNDTTKRSIGFTGRIKNMCKIGKNG